MTDNWYEFARNKIVKEYKIPREWCYEPLWEEHTIRISEGDEVLFDGTIKKLIETMDEEGRYFWKED